MRRAFVYIEVLISMLLICLAMGSIVSAYVRSARILRTSMKVAAASRILQQRVEMIREQPWTEISNSRAISKLMAVPTKSEGELEDPRLVETMQIILPVHTKRGLVESDRWISVRRSSGKAEVEQAEDFSTDGVLLVECSVSWYDHTGRHERSLRVIINRAGLTRSGIMGAAFGRPDARVTNAE